MLRTNLLVLQFALQGAEGAGSSCSTFLATLKIIPMDKQVNRKLLPPMLTSGSVTPVFGNAFTATPILANACITSVKLSASARNAPNA